MAAPTTQIKNLQSEINTLHSLALKATTPQVLFRIHQFAVSKQSALNTLLDAQTQQPATTTISSLWSSSSKAPLTEEEAQKIQGAVTRQIAEISSKLKQIKPTTSSSIAYQSSSSSSTVSSSSFAPIGFSNQGSNCWCNCLLQMVVHVPSIRTVYEVVARDCQYSPGNPDLVQAGTAMLNALEQYEQCTKNSKPVPASISQQVRLAMHKIFPSISDSALDQEDANEAIQLLMGKYQEIAEKTNTALLPSLYTPQITRRIYTPVDTPKEPDSYKLELTKRDPHHENAYTRLTPDFAVAKENPEYQIFLDLQNKEHLIFNDLLKSFFYDNREEDAKSVYLLPHEDLIQDFKLKSENRQFLTPPQEFFISIKRFGFDFSSEKGFKITTPVTIPRVLTLPPESTVSAVQEVYDLDFFIVHRGGYGGGHYHAYRKIEGRWYLCDDSSTRPIDDDVIDQILSNSVKDRSILSHVAASHYSSYIHHYHLRGAENASSSSSSLKPSFNSLMTVCQARTQMHTKYQRCLEQINQLLLDSNGDKDTISTFLKQLPSSMLQQIDYLIWINDKMPNTSNYGTSVRENNPRYLKEIRLPWVTSVGENLIEQLIAIEKKERSISEVHEIIYQLEYLIEQMNNSAVSDQTMNQTFALLPESVQNHIYYLIYRCHLLKHSESVVHHPQYEGRYGHKIVEEQGIRAVLCNATESVLNAHGKNIIEQLKIHYEKIIVNEKLREEKEILEGYFKLLQYPEEQIQSSQLSVIFDSLKISLELKEKFNVAVAASTVPLLSEEERDLKKNPRLLISITEPLFVLASEAKKLSLIEQMIHSLSSNL